MNCTTPPNKKFKEDIKVFKHKIENSINFTFSKYADGEWAVIKNGSINNTEFWFDNNSFVDSMKRDRLIESFKFRHPQYYVGISCPCCQGQQTFEDMKSMSQQPDEMLTWANLWVNDNYKYYVSDILPLYNARKVVLYCNKDGDIDSLPFKPDKIFPVSNNAWDSDWDIIEESKDYILQSKAKDVLFLMCCGPFGNILCHELTKFNADNTYIDVGSTLNPFLKTGFARHYYVDNSVWSQLECVWGE